MTVSGVLIFAGLAAFAVIFGLLIKTLPPEGIRAFLGSYGMFDPRTPWVDLRPQQPGDVTVGTGMLHLARAPRELIEQPDSFDGPEPHPAPVQKGWPPLDDRDRGALFRALARCVAEQVLFVRDEPYLVTSRRIVRDGRGSVLYIGLEAASGSAMRLRIVEADFAGHGWIYSGTVEPSNVKLAPLDAHALLHDGGVVYYAIWTGVGNIHDQLDGLNEEALGRFITHVLSADGRPATAHDASVVRLERVQYGPCMLIRGEEVVFSGSIRFPDSAA